MKNKKWLMPSIVVVLIIMIALSAFGYVGIQGNNIENKMWEYLKENNYEENEIASLKVKHSFMNILLSYNEWTIEVVFEDELTSVYTYSYKDGVIVEGGVYGTTDKEDLKH